MNYWRILQWVLATVALLVILALVTGSPTVPEATVVTPSTPENSQFRNIK